MEDTLLERSIKYANDVVTGKDTNNKYVKKQCELFLNDYDNRDNDNYKYCFDFNLITIIESLCKIMFMPTGFSKDKTVFDSLSNFQCLILVNIFGVKHRDNIKKRRYKTFTLFIPRKNGKNFIVALILTLCFLLEDAYTEMYSISLDRDLASMTKKALMQLIECSPYLTNRFKLSSTLNGKVTCKLNNSFFQARTSIADKNNSILPTVIVEDEIGAMESYSNLNAIESGQLNILNPLILKISTAYPLNESIMISEVEYSKKVLDGIVEDERIFSLLYYADEENLWNDTGIEQANPLKIEANFNEIKDMRKKALVIQEKKVEFLTKHLNVFVQENKDQAFLDINLWKKCEVDKVDFEGKEVVVSLDASVSLDLTSVSIMYKEDNKYYTSAHAFLCEGNLKERREKIDYYNMERLGYCTINEGNTVSYMGVENYIRDIESKYNCRINCIVSDPYNMKTTVESLAEDYEVVILKQSFNNLTVATQGLKEIVYNGKFFYEKNDLLTWCVSNTILNVGKSGHVMVAKDKAEKNKKRIDMCATTIFCLTELYSLDSDYDPVRDFINSDW